MLLVCDGEECAMLLTFCEYVHALVCTLIVILQGEQRAHANGIEDNKIVSDQGYSP